MGICFIRKAEAFNETLNFGKRSEINADTSLNQKRMFVLYNKLQLRKVAPNDLDYS